MARSEAQKAAERRYEEKNKAKRSARKDFWLFEFYPDSAPENWREIINSWLVDCLVSPLHDS
ncbi:MAG: Rep family protein, partial [Collinsella sp.]|nr:Rep family protein [Collinsella sp.]